MADQLTVLEICAGAGGQSIGLEKAGFFHTGAVEIDARACQTLRLNRPEWHVVEEDVHDISGRDYRGVDLVAGGVPCPSLSVVALELPARRTFGTVHLPSRSAVLAAWPGPGTT